MSKAIMIDYKYCSGCHSCEIACQQEHELAPDKYGIEIKQIGPDQITERIWELDYIPVLTDRCDRCTNRLAKGKLPSCVQHCQAGCISIGSTAELAAQMKHKKMVLYS
jgi:anaerobic dimethyl sulfoxide reductase subunit B (iron-sulfur subunit)